MQLVRGNKEQDVGQPVERVGNMEIVKVKNRKDQKKFINFRKEIYNSHPEYVDNNLFMIKELFAKRTCFVNNKEINVIYIEEDDKILCQGMVVYTKELPEYIQLCFFESRENQEKAVNLLVDEAIRIGREYHCKKLVIGLNGHVNYGLGLLCSHHNEKNSFSSSVNPRYYNDYFEKMNCSNIYLNTYKAHSFDEKMKSYERIINKINKNYTFKYFNKKEFEYYSKIYTDLNNECFVGHRYYYKREYNEDKEMLKELFLFMKEDSLIFAFHNDKPIGFVLWYPDFNELIKNGGFFGVKEFFKNIFLNKKIETAKVMEYGAIEEYRRIGLPLALLYQVYLATKKYNIKKAETSWILDENKDSNSVCQAICDEEYKRYVVYEKDIN